MSLTSAPTPASVSVPNPRRWRALPIVLSATFMALFDFFVVNVAAPSIQGDLHASGAGVELIVGGYAFAYASGLVTGGRLGDLYGHRRLFLAGMAAFALASLLCGLAQNPTELVAARLLQGLAAAAMVPQVLALITAMFSGPERTKALAWFGVTAGVGSVAGQVLGGILLDANVLGLQWRSIFLINVPVGAVAIVAAMRELPVARTSSGSRLDPVGAIGISVALGLLLVPLVLGRSEGWPTCNWIAIGASVPTLLATLAWEHRLATAGREPTLHLALFGDRAFNAGLLGNAAFMAFFGSFMLCLTIVLQSGLGLDPRAAGLTFAPLGVVFALASVLGRRFVVRYGAPVIGVGAVISAAGMALLAAQLFTAGGSADAESFIGPMVLVGLGNGLALPALTGAVLAGIRTRAGAAAGVLTTTQQFASAVGVAALGTVFFTLLGGHPDRAAYAHAMAVVALIDIALVVATGALSALLPRPRRVEVVAEGNVPDRELQAAD